MMKLIWAFLLLSSLSYGQGTEILVKVGSKYPDINDSKHDLGWRDGQVVDIRASGSYTGKMIKKHFALIQLPNIDYWELRGDTDWKSTKQSALNLKKYLSVADGSGKHEWEDGYIDRNSPHRTRDFFVDFQWLLNEGVINQSQYNSVYDKKSDQLPIALNYNSLDDLFRHEDLYDRLNSEKDQTKGTISTGTFSIGSGLDYDTVTAFEADIEATQTGNLTGEHNDEETAISSSIVFNHDPAGYVFTLTAQSGDEHNGGVYGNGARINYGTSDGLSLQFAGNSGTVVIENLALDVSGSGNTGITFNNTDSPTVYTRALLIQGNSSSDGGIAAFGSVGTFYIYNNIIYGFSNTHNAWQRGCAITYRAEWAADAGTFYIYNNSVMKNTLGINIDHSNINGTYTVINNLAQGNTTDYEEQTGGFDTHAKNISEDATSPDGGIYDNLNCHDATSSFVDYANDDYRLVDGGTDNGIIDDGDDLSGTFADDVIGTTRSTWWIGAYELVVAAARTGQLMRVIEQ